MSEIIPRTLLAVALAASLVPGAFAQDEPERVFDDTVEVSEVLLDVLVTDSRGNTVAGLGPEDFEVVEDGSPMEILDATFYSNRTIAASSRAAQELGGAQAAEPRYFIFFFHDVRRAQPNLMRRQLNAAREAAEWVTTSLGPNDLVAVAGYNASLYLFQDFTHDVPSIVEALDAASRDRRKKSLQRASRVPSGPTSIAAALPAEKGLSKKTGTIYDGLRQLAEAMVHIQGRKNVLMFTPGFGSLNDGFWTPEARYHEPMVRTLNANNVALYTLDLFPVGVDHPLSQSLSLVAHDTNAEYYYDVPNYTGPLKEIGNENSGYYLLSYRSSHPRGSQGYQEVEVKALNKDFKVRARRGYLFGY